MSGWMWMAVASVAIVAILFRTSHRFLGSTWFDFIVPWANPFTQAGRDKEEKRNADALAAAEGRIKNANRDALKVLLTGITSLMEIEAERRRSVDTRLSTIVGLASIAATVAMGVIIAQAGGTLKVSDVYGRWVLATLAIYIIVQLCDAIYWAVRGQARHGYRIDTVEDLLPLPHASEEDQLRLRIISWVKQLQFNQASINEKVTAMGVAHQAAKNFAGGFLLLSVVAMAMMTLKSADSPALEELQSNAQLRELLRGPAGADGAQGPIGPTGSPGATGPKGEVGPPGPSAPTR